MGPIGYGYMENLRFNFFFLDSELISIIWIAAVEYIC